MSLWVKGSRSMAASPECYLGIKDQVRPKKACKMSTIPQENAGDPSLKEAPGADAEFHTEGEREARHQAIIR